MNQGVRERVPEVVIAVIVGALVVGGILAVTGNRDPVVVTTVPVPAGDPPVDPRAFIDQWETSLRAEYAAVGVITEFDDNTILSQRTIRIARTPDRRLDQTGSASIVTMGDEQRPCEPEGGESGGVIVCGPPQVAPTVEQELAVVVSQVSGDDPTYLLYPEGESCWVAIAAEPSPTRQWGQATTFCFDAVTGALMSRSSVNGSRRDVLELTEIRSNVTDDDLAPTVG